MLLALPAFADDVLPPLPVPAQCDKDLGVCVMATDVFAAMIEAHNYLTRENRELKDKGKKVECAKTEVTEPPKRPIPPIPKESDS